MQNTGRVYPRYDAHVFARCRLVAQQEAAKRPPIQTERKPVRWHPAFAGFINFQPFEFKAEEEKEEIGV